MSKVYVDTVEPSTVGKDLTLGGTGDNVVISANSINNNILKDSGGNIYFQSDGSGTLSNVNSAFTGNLKLLSTQTAADDASVSFTSGIDSTYDLYMFKFINANPVSGSYVNFQFEGSINGGSGYGVTKTTTFFGAKHYESDSSSSLGYIAGGDEAQSTDPQILFSDTGEDADQNCSGELFLFAPSNTTYVKHFYSTSQGSSTDDQTQNFFMGGYFNTTSAINAIKFSFSAGNIDSATVKMYGL